MDTIANIISKLHNRCIKSMVVDLLLSNDRRVGQFIFVIGTEGS